MPTRLCAPIDVQVEVTELCNQNCSHCYNYWRPVNTQYSAKSLSFRAIRRIVDQLTINQVPFITITGGEPFVRKLETLELIGMAGEAGMHVSINSNFSLINASDLDFLAKRKNLSMLASLLSAGAGEHERLSNSPRGRFSQVIEKLQMAIGRGISVGVNMVIRNDNIHAMFETAAIAKKLGARSFCATRVLPNVAGGDNSFLLSREELLFSLGVLMRIEKELMIPVDILGCYPKCLLVGTWFFERFYHRICVAGCTTLTIGADGAVRPCSHVNIGYGNVLDEPLEAIWNRMDDWRDGKFFPTSCLSCTLLDSCRGGCRVNNQGSDLSNEDMHTARYRLDDLTAGSIKPGVIREAIEVPSGLVVHPNTRFRKEAFGATVYRNDYPTIVLLNRRVTEFLKQELFHREAITPSGFLQYSGAISDGEKKSVMNLYRKLYRKKILVEPEQKGGEKNEQPS